MAWFQVVSNWKCFQHFEVFSLTFLKIFSRLLPLLYLRNCPFKCQNIKKLFSIVFIFRKQKNLQTNRIVRLNSGHYICNKILLLQETIVLFESEYWCLLQVDSSFYFWLPISFGKKKDIFSGLVPADLIRETPCHSNDGEELFLKKNS